MEHIFLASKVVGSENRKFDSGKTTHVHKIVISKFKLIRITLLSENINSLIVLFLIRIVAGLQPNQ